MKQVTQHNQTGEVRVESVPLPALKEGHVLVRTHVSLISAGTEKASIAARKATLLQKAQQQPEQVKKVLEQIKHYGLLPTYRRVKARLNAAMPIGYSAAGEVIDTGNDLTDIKVGDRVACAGAGYANHAEIILVPRNLCAKIPVNVEFDEAAYTTVGAIALQGVRQANVTLGEHVVVIGLGLVGQLTVQILKASGCAVIGVDLDPAMIRLARECGADKALRRDEDDIKNILQAFTKGVGADAVLITAATPSNDPVQLAGELCREKGRVVLVGDVGTELPRRPYYMKELEFKLSRSLGPGRYDLQYEERGLDYPVGFVRWTENRNMQEFLRLLADKRIDVRRLTTHHFNLDDAPEAYKVLTGGKKGPRFVGVLLDYGATDGGKSAKPVKRIDLRSWEGKGRPSPLNIGFLGAGDFAQGFLIPNVRRIRGASLVGACTGNGLNAKNVAAHFGFQFATTDSKEILDGESIGTVFIATRHHLHARYTVEALRSGKNVFVEKPLALTYDGLEEIVAAYRSRSERAGKKGKEPEARGPLLMVGYNRRFAPQVRQMKRFFEQAVGPLSIQYRINAGLVPVSHWTRDPVEGGGRILGEVCHFVDLMQYITTSVPTRVFAESLSSRDAGTPNDDSVVITLKFLDGSVGVISYLANGDPAVPKERLEVFSTGRTAVLENFQHLTLYQQGKKREFKQSTVDKGHRDEVAAFLQAAREGRESPIPFESLRTTTITTLKIVESLRVGVPVSV